MSTSLFDDRGKIYGLARGPVRAPTLFQVVGSLRTCKSVVTLPPLALFTYILPNFLETVEKPASEAKLSKFSCGEVKNFEEYRTYFEKFLTSRG